MIDSTHINNIQNSYTTDSDVPVTLEMRMNNISGSEMPEGYSLTAEQTEDEKEIKESEESEEFTPEDAVEKLVQQFAYMKWMDRVMQTSDDAEKSSML